VAVFGPAAGLLQDVRHWLANPELNFGWLLKVENEDTPYTARHFGSKELPPAPELIVQYEVPAIPQIADPRSADGTFRFTITGVIGRRYRVQSSNNVSGPWTELTNAPATLTDESIPFSIFSQDSRGFYRVVAE
jgi:hypothetical protein